MKRFALLAIERLELSIEQVRDVVWLSQFDLGGRVSARGDDDRAAIEPPPVAPPSTPPPAPPKGEETGREPSSVPPPAPTPTSTPIDLVAPARGGAGGADTPRLQAPAAAPLGRRMDLARALRPMGWRVARPDRYRLVEDATADRVAETDVWVPVLVPETEPALDLAVVLDVDPSLRPWREVMRSLVKVVRTSGVFRNVTVWTIGSDGSAVVLRRGMRGAPRRDPRHLIDPSGRTAIMVVSDFCAPVWRSKEGLRWLRTWAARTIISLLTLYPHRLWPRTVLGSLAHARLRSTRRGQPSATLASDPGDREALPLPVITVDPASVAAWARQVAGDDRERTIGVLALEDLSVERRARFTARVGLRGEPVDADTFDELVAAARELLVEPTAPTSAAERVEAFARGARPEVVRVASAFARSPLRLDVMRVVQHALAPRTGPLELAEILGSSLFTLESPAGVHDDEVWFTVDPDVRERLAELTPGRDGLRVLEAVGAYVRDQLGTAFDLEALLIDPDRPFTTLPDQLQPFGRIFVEELERLGGRYRELAARLKTPPPPTPAPELASAPVPFRGHWVLVGGSDVLLGEDARAAEAVGAALARAGFGLITCGWEGVDHVTARAYDEARFPHRDSPRTHSPRLIQVTGDRRTPSYRGAAHVVIHSARDERTEAVRRASAVVIVGGRTWTRELLDIATAHDRKTVAVHGTGGAADSAARDHLVTASVSMASVETASAMAAMLVDLLAGWVADESTTVSRDRETAALLLWLHDHKLMPTAALVDVTDPAVTLAGRPRAEQLEGCSAVFAWSELVGRDSARILAAEIFVRLEHWVGLRELGLHRPPHFPALATEVARRLPSGFERPRFWFELRRHAREENDDDRASSFMLRLEHTRLQDNWLRELHQLAEEAGDDAVAVWCGELLRGFDKSSDVAGREFFAEMARRYEEIRKTQPAGVERTAVLDQLVERVAVRARYMPIDADYIDQMYSSGDEGSRIVTLALYSVAPSEVSVAPIADAIRWPLSAFEQWTALGAALAVVAALPPLVSEPCVAAALTLELAHESSRRGRADELIDSFVRRLGIPGPNPRDAVRQWVDAGDESHRDGRRIAVFGADRGGHHAQLCRLLGERLAAHGYAVAAKDGYRVGGEVLHGYRSVEATPARAVDRGGEELVAMADGALVVGGGANTKAECVLARLHHLPVVPIAFTGGTAAALAEELRATLVNSGVSPTLLALLANGEDAALAAETAVRVLNIALSTPRDVPAETPPPAPFTLYDEAGVRAWLEAAGHCRPDEILDVLNIFATRRQRTWLVFLRGHVLCVFDDAETREGHRLLQFKATPNELLPLTAEPRPDSRTTGALAMGPRRRWPYSLSLFPEPAALVARVTALLDRAAAAQPAAAESSPATLEPATLARDLVQSLLHGERRVLLLQGPHASGKTTLLRGILRELKPATAAPVMVSLREARTLDDLIDEVVVQLGRVAPREMDVMVPMSRRGRSTAENLFQIASSHHDGAWLILDDIDGPLLSDDLRGLVHWLATLVAREGRSRNVRLILAGTDIVISEEARAAALIHTLQDGVVFLSFAQRDRRMARHVDTALRQRGIPTWFDGNDLAPGANPDRAIALVIERVTLFVPFMSRHSLEQARSAGPRSGRAWRRLTPEWRYACNRAVSIAAGVPFIVPIALDELDPISSDVPDEFRRVQWFQWSEDRPVEAIVDVIEKLYRQKMESER